MKSLNNKNIGKKIPNPKTKIKKISSFKEKINPFLEKLLKPKLFTEKFIPKNIIASEFKNNKNINEKINIDNENSNNEDSFPIKDKILYIQKKIEKNNEIIRSLSEENKIFHKRYQKAIKLQEKNNLRKKIINLNENLNNKGNNVFNKSILLINEDTNINNLLIETNINECKEDLQIIEKFKNTYKEGKNVEYPFYILDNINKAENKIEDIPKIKKEIEKTKKTINDLEKKEDFDYFDLDKDKKKAFDLLKNKIMQINLNKKNKKPYINNISFPLSLTDKKGTYKLVTKCEINNKNNKNYNKITKEYNNSTSKYNLFDFSNEYNRLKQLLGPSTKTKNSSSIFTLNNKIEPKKKLVDKNKLFLEEDKSFNSINLSLDNNSELENKNFDIHNIYSFLQYKNYERAKLLFSNYIRKYNRKYDMEINNKELGMKLNPLINDIQKNSLKYNISDKLKTLNYSKFIDLNLFQSRKRKATINKIKKLDEKMKNIGYDSIEGILELNQDLII